MKEVRTDQLDWKKGNGLIPVVVQDASSKEVLTLAYLNMEALELTLRTGFAHYYRRSHGKVMMKGVSSGNTQAIVSILTDCDHDSVIYLVNQKGPACHLGRRSCFLDQVTEKQDCTQ